LNRTLILILIVALVLGALFFALRPAPLSIEPQARSFDLQIQGATMTPDELSTEEGDLVTLRITADHPLEFHLHGYDLEEEVEPGEPAALSFEADITGRFEIEEEQTQPSWGRL